MHDETLHPACDEFLGMPLDEEEDMLVEEKSQTDDGADWLDLPDMNFQGQENPQRGGSEWDEDNESDQQEEDDHDTLGHAYPKERERLLQQLKGEYTCPKDVPLGLIPPRQLIDTEKLSLQHYIAWQKSNGTEFAYKLHAQVLQDATDVEILPLKSVKKLAMDLSGMRPQKIDICPNSCIAYTGVHENLTHCPHIKDKKKCNEPRYNKKSKPRAQMVYLSCFDVIKVMYANVETSNLLQHQDRLLQKTIYTINQMKTYSDFGDSHVQEHLYHDMHFFGDGRDIALGVSTDGAQLNPKKPSNAWLVVLILLNLPPEICYQTNNVLVPFIVPGPNSPGDLESFLYPLFVDMAKASEGIWMWDAVESSVFINHAHICMVLGDMLGSAKISGMAGHTAVHGDRFSMVQAACSSSKKGAKYLYYPISTPASSKYNEKHPKLYDLNKLPIRTENKYWEIIEQLSSATSKAQHILYATCSCISCIYPPFIFPFGSFSSLF